MTFSGPLRSPVGGQFSTFRAINRMIRRFIPKGSDISKLSPGKIRQVEEWMNNYPRKIL